MNRRAEPLPDGINFVNVWDNAMVSSRVVIVHGQVRSTPPGVGSVVVTFKDFPAQRYPMSNGYFKAVVPLELGENVLKFEAEPPKGSKVADTLRLKYQPIDENPPVHFCLLVAKDSPGLFDSPPQKANAEGNNIDVAVKKLRLASYLMSAFTMEQMNRNQMGMRTFRIYEENEHDTISCRDQAPARRTTHIHIVKMDKTVAEIRDPDVAQQYNKAKRAGDLFGYAADALRKYGGPFASNEFTQAACIFIDTHWDPSMQLVRGHAALGGNAGSLRLAIFGGHTLHSWPTCLEDMPAAFLDQTKTDTKCVANDANQSGTSWEACNIGQGAFMHEVGHLLGCPHEPSGVMLRGYLNWNRSFMVLEGYNSRESRAGLQVIPSKDEDYWHRLDIMRFRFHPSFALPGEPKAGGGKPVAFPAANGVYITCPSGVYMVDIHADGNSRGHIEFMDLPKAVTLSLDDIKRAIPPEFHNKAIDLHIHSPPMEQANISNVQEFIKNSREGSFFKSAISGREAGEKRVVQLPDLPLVSVTVYSGNALDGIEFTYKDQSVLFGNKGGSPHSYKVEGDQALGLCVRSGYWVDACGVILTRGRTDITGGSGGGQVDLLPPQGHRLAGIYGYFERWCQGIGILYEG